MSTSGTTTRRALKQDADMELRSTLIGQQLAQHPYNHVRLLNAGIELRGVKHICTIPFNQLIAVNCRRGIIWGELEFELLDQQVARLHGTEWQATQQFYHQMMLHWREWDKQMSVVVRRVLSPLVQELQERESLSRWMTRAELQQYQVKLQKTFDTLPVPEKRLPQLSLFDSELTYLYTWLAEGEKLRLRGNQRYQQDMQKEYANFFTRLPSRLHREAPLSTILSEEPIILLRGGPGCGKTTVLAARVAWLIERGTLPAEQILILASSIQQAEFLTAKLHQFTGKTQLEVMTLHSLAATVNQKKDKERVQPASVMLDRVARQQLLLSTWQQQCQEKKAHAKGWYQWLSVLGWTDLEDAFWLDERLTDWLGECLERWVLLLREWPGNQAELLAQAQEEDQGELQKQLRLLAPLLKAWKKALKDEGSADLTSLLPLAIDRLAKQRFEIPWRAIFVDDFQDFPHYGISLLQAMYKQVPNLTLYVTGNSGQALFRPIEPSGRLQKTVMQNFGFCECDNLSISSRCPQSLFMLANDFLQQNPHEEKQPLKEITGKTTRAPVSLLPEIALEKLLDKLSSFVTAEETILILTRYESQQPACMAYAASRWPGLNCQVLTIDQSQGFEADYVIICGLQAGKKGFPARNRVTLLETVLLPEVAYFPDAEERRRLFVALTRAKKEVWLLFDANHPSVFVEQLVHLGVTVKKKP